ncbi:o-succinylbenzoate--CoA ligase [Nakamurella panacisegetis]|nr:o-succinylbenzoate--CoA ligase [Nakamurella panacisegetis]
MRPRTVELLEVPTGGDLQRLLPRLRAALEGQGPALAPVAAGDHSQIELLTSAFGIGTQLAPAEDDEHDPTAVVIATSGSTGTPKGSLLPRSALLASAQATQDRLGPPGSWLLTLPAQHIAGLQVLLRSIASGTTPHLMDTGRTFTPERFVEATNALPEGPRYVSLVPTQLHRILTDHTATAALATYTAVLVGGSATASDLLRRAGEAGATVRTTYGMSETCGGCVYDGIPLDGVTATTDEDGRISLHGPVVGRGYRNRPGHPAFARPGTYRTDDHGTWTDGRLRIVGRIDDVIITGGLKIAPAPVEDAIAELPSVAQVLLVGVPDAEWGQRLVAVVVPADPSRPPTLQDVQVAAGTARPTAMMLVTNLPTRGPGKPDRRAAADLAARRLA